MEGLVTKTGNGPKRHTTIGGVLCLLAILSGGPVIGLGLASVVPPHNISWTGFTIAATIFVAALCGTAASLKDKSSVINLFLYCLTLGALIGFLRIVFFIARNGLPISLPVGAAGVLALCLCIGSAAVMQLRSKAAKRSHRRNTKPKNRSTTVTD